MEKEHLPQLQRHISNIEKPRALCNGNAIIRAEEQLRRVQEEDWKRKKNIYLKCDDTSPTVGNGSTIIRAKERLRRRSKMIGNGKKPWKTTVIPFKTPRRETA
jgi:hypothetical protein